MKAPEKIYVNFFNSDMWSISVFNDGNPEYTRTDAFIEKASSWLRNRYRDYMYNPTGERLEAFFGIDMCNDFVNYMKGE